MAVQAVVFERRYQPAAALARPARDEKILADWNGLLINALVEGAIVLDEPTLVDRGLNVLAFIRENHWDGTALTHRYKEGDLMEAGFLPDYAFLATGALTLHGATGELEPLRFALDLGRAIKDKFWDETESALYYTTSTDGVPIRPRNVTEQSTPSSTAETVSLFAALEHFVPDSDFASVAQKVIDGYSDQLRTNPAQNPTLVLANDVLQNAHLEIVVAAEKLPESWRDILSETYLPTRLLTRRPPDPGRRRGTTPRSPPSRGVEGL